MANPKAKRGEANMKHYLLITGVIALLFLVLFLVVELLQPELMANLAGLMDTRSLAVALIGICLLFADVLLPIPSSLIMIANGALFGIVAGTILSLIGCLCGSLFGFWLGRHGKALFARFVPLEEQRRADKLLADWGWLAIIITRPFPLLAETTVIMAGASTMMWQTMLLTSLAGSLPIALLYSLTGATAMSFDSLTLSFSLALVMAGIFWLASRIFRLASGNQSKEAVQ
jgi:uncharacterized membrane protein YdjX (TVP38/TMEM64 family)